MKKVSLIIAIGAALSLASCAQDEPVSTHETVEEDAISFRPAMGVASRATETTNANLSSITVTALIGDQTLFHDIDYTKGSDSFFNSATPYYWPGDNTSVDFYAYAPNADALGADVVINSKQKELQSYVTPEQIADQVDFITANASGSKDANGTTGVELTFGHRLSQIEIRAKADNPNYVYKVTGARIGRPQTTATFDFSTSEWTLDDWHETAVYDATCPEVTLSATPVSIMGDAGNAMLIPQTLTPWSPTGDPDNVAREAYLSVLIQITTADGAQVYPFPSDTKKDENGQKRQYAWASIPLSGTWEAGKKYVYTLDFSNGAGYVDPDDPIPGKSVLGDPIKFSVNVTDWDNSESDIPMPLK